MSTATIFKGPHVLYVGSNGQTTFGITVRATCPVEESRSRGYLHEWKINDYTILCRKNVADLLGLTPEEHGTLMGTIFKLVENDRK